MISNWKSLERVRWEPQEDQFLLEQIKKFQKESHMDLARKIIDNQLVEGRTLDAVEQRIGLLRAKLRKGHL
jgi:uncharacterized protein YprB with RNaseH-like and TPR domain